MTVKKEDAELPAETSENRRIHRYNVRYWDTNPAGREFKFPEQEDPELFYPPLKGKEDRGICFSGGGTVSVSLIAGYIDALQELGLMDQVGYVSGVSGGTWGTAPYMYYTGENDQDLLGKHKDPQKITVEEISSTEPGTLAGMCTHARIADLSIAFAMHDTTKGLLYNAFEEAVGQIFLQPAGIHSPILRYQPVAGVPHFKRLQKERDFFTTTEEVAQNISDQNAVEGITTKDFIKLKEGRPYYIMNTTMLVPEDKKSDPTVYPFEVTPLYAGMYPVQNGVHIHGNKQQIGGLYVESFGFNTRATNAPNDGQISSENKHRYELSQPVGTSGAAPAEEIQKKASAKLLQYLFPNFKYWNPINSPTEKPETFRYYYGDGGLIENMGITPMLVRKVKNVVCFISQMTFFFPNGSKDATIDIGESGWSQIAFGYNQICQLFGGKLINTSEMKKKRKAHLKTQIVPVIWIKDTMDRQVFDNPMVPYEGGETSLLNVLISTFNSANDQGGPVSANMQLDVIDNAIFGVSGGWNVNVKFTLLGTCQNWMDELQEDVKSLIGKGELSNFPNVKTFIQNPPHIIQLTAKQTNMLGNLAYWILKEEQQDYVNLLTGKGFEG